MKEKSTSDAQSFLFSERLTWANKNKHNGKWYEMKADAIERQQPEGYEEDEKRMLDNFNMYNDIAPRSHRERYTTDDPTAKEDGYGDFVGSAPYFGVASQVANTMHGLQQKSALEPIVRDISNYNSNERKRAKNKEIQNYLRESIVKPIQERVTQDYFAENNITDPYSQLTPEQLFQADSEIMQRIKASTPKDIDEYFSKGYSGEAEIQAQSLTNLFLVSDNIKFKSDENFRNGLITGKQIYSIDVYHDRPTVSVVNPIGFYAWGEDDDYFFEDYNVFRQRTQISYPEIFNRYSGDLTNADLKKLENLSGLGSGYTDNDYLAGNIIGNIDVNSEREISNIDVMSTKGQQEYMSWMSKVYNGGLGHVNTVTHTRYVWKSLRKMKYITRKLQSGGVKEFYIDGSYKFSKERGDISQKIMWIPEFNQTIKLGDGFSESALYIRKGPLAYQYRSVNNPWDIKGPYYGMEYNKLMGNPDHNVGPMDRAKVWDDELQREMLEIRRLDDTNIGKVTLVALDLLADEDPAATFKLMKYSKMLPINFKDQEMNSTDVSNLFRSIDLSTLYEILPRLQRVNSLIDRIAMSMSFNSSMLGTAPASTTVGNNNQNINQSLTQSNSIYYYHNKILENLFNGLLNAARISYRKNPQFLSHVLSDGSIAELELDGELLWRSEIGIVVRNSIEDSNNLSTLKQMIIQPLIQNGQIDAPDVTRAFLSKSVAEINNIMSVVNEKNEAKIEGQIKAQRLNEQEKAQMESQLKELDFKLKRILQKDNNDAKIKMAEIGSTVIKKGNDVDGNEISDFITKDRIAHKNKKELLETKIEFEREKLKSKKS